MTLATALSFRVPRPERVNVQRWWILDGTQAVDAPDVLPHWDALTRIEVNCDLNLDLDGVRSDCGLGADARFGIVLRWQSGGTSVRGVGPLRLLTKTTRDVTLNAFSGGLREIHFAAGS